MKKEGEKYMENFEKTFTVMGEGAPSSEKSTREFKEPVVEIELLEENVILMSGVDDFDDPVGDYDPNALWE